MGPSASINFTMGTEVTIRVLLLWENSSWREMVANVCYHYTTKANCLLTAFKTNGPVNVSSKTKLIKWNSFCPFGAELGEAISGRAELLCHYAQFVSGNLAFCPSDIQRQDAASSALPRSAHCSAAAASLGAAVTAVQLLHRWKLW